MVRSVGRSDDWVVHGDLYENQVLFDGATLGLIDLDDLGPGDPLLDAANFCAHLLLLGTSRPAPTVLRFRDELRAAVCRRFEPIGPIWPGGRRIACCAWPPGPSGSCIPSGPAG